jgi:hypothetical protein
MSGREVFYGTWAWGISRRRRSAGRAGVENTA